MYIYNFQKTDEKIQNYKLSSLILRIYNAHKIQDKG